MGHQPEYCQPHSHKQTEPILFFVGEKARQTTFLQSVYQNLLSPVRLISHSIVTPLMFDK